MLVLKLILLVKRGRWFAKCEVLKDFPNNAKYTAWQIRDYIEPGHVWTVGVFEINSIPLYVHAWKCWMGVIEWVMTIS